MHENNRWIRLPQIMNKRKRLSFFIFYEKFAGIQRDQYGNEKEDIWFLMDNINGTYHCLDKDMGQMMSIIAKNSLLCYMIDTTKFEYLGKIKAIITEFAKKIDFVNMNNIPMKKTIDLMKNKNQLQQKIVNFIKDADLYLDDFEYVDMDKIQLKIDKHGEKPDEKVLDFPESLMDQLRLVSTYKGIPVPSMIFDSTGTKKLQH